MWCGLTIIMLKILKFVPVINNNFCPFKFLQLDIGTRLMPCFTKSPSPIPYSDVNLISHMAQSPKWSPDSSTAEVSTIQLEFRDLSRSTGQHNFEVSNTSIVNYLNCY